MPLCINNNNEGAAKRCLVCSLVGVFFVWVLELIVGVCGALSDLAVWKAPHVLHSEVLPSFRYLTILPVLLSRD